MPIAIMNPVDGQPVSFRAVATNPTDLQSGEVLYSGPMPIEDVREWVWSAAANAPVAPSVLIQAQAAQARAINSAYAAYLSAGYADSATGATMPIDVNSQNTFAADWIGLTRAIALGSIQPNDVLPPYGLTATAYDALLARAWAYCRAAFFKLQALLGQIAAAADPAVVLTIVWT